MAAPFESKDGLTWADQWDNYSSASVDSSSHKQQEQQPSQKEKMTGKIKSTATTGLDKAKVVASASARKVKSGTNSGIKWMKEQYQKKTKK